MLNTTNSSTMKVTCHKDKIVIRMIPKPFTHLYKVATIEIHPHGEFDIIMEKDLINDQLEIDLFMQDLEKILR